VLIVLAWRARPNSWHGVAAVAALGVLGGFRQSLLTAFALLALIAVIGSTRRWSRLALTVAVAAGSVGVWLLPMVMEQPGGFAVWLHASHTESVGAEQITSVLDHAAGCPGPGGRPPPAPPADGPHRRPAPVWLVADRRQQS
jgi:hypothetical protein